MLMPHANEVVVVRHPEAENFMVALDPAVDYDPNDPLVLRYPQFFVPRENIGEIIESVKIERATAAPGEKRTRSTAKKSAKKPE
jgi:hypothetical protein